MKPYFWVVALAAGMAAFAAARAQAPAGAGRLTAVVHVDIAPPIPPGTPPDAANKLRSDANALGRALVMEWAGDCKRELGCERIDVLMQRGALNHFTLIEVFANAEAQANFESLPAVRSLRDRIQPILGGPLDQRFSSKIN